MVKTIVAIAVVGSSILATPAAIAQEAGDVVVRVAASRTKLVDKGVVRTNGVVDPGAAYSTRETYHGTLSASYFPIEMIGIDASITTPATTNNIPAGSLAGLPNLGDDEFVVASIGARFQPRFGPIAPYVAGGYSRHFTTQERDGLAVDLDIGNTSGPYVEGGAEFRISRDFGVFASVRKTYYTTTATGRLPLDATYTSFADVDASAQLDPFTISVGGAVHLGTGRGSGQRRLGRDESDWIIRGGLTSLVLADKVELSVGGAPFPGAGLSTFEHYTPSVQISRFLTRHIAVGATLGLPPTIDVFGAGSIGALPKLGEITYGPTVFALQYHPLRSGRIRPYFGAGVSYMIVFGTEDGAFADLEVENDLGPAFEAGTDVMIDERWGLFFDIRKAFLRPKTTGSFMGAPVEGQTRLDPWALSGGVSFRF